MDIIYEILVDLRPEFDFSQSSDFIADGLLDSFDIVAFIVQIEEIIGVKIDGMDILPENFQNIETIARLIRKSGGNI